jgi:hypothetical protein
LGLRWQCSLDGIFSAGPFPLRADIGNFGGSERTSSRQFVIHEIYRLCSVDEINKGHEFRSIVTDDVKKRKIFFTAHAIGRQPEAAP